MRKKTIKKVIRRLHLDCDVCGTERKLKGYKQKTLDKQRRKEDTEELDNYQLWEYEDWATRSGS